MTELHPFAKSLFRRQAARIEFEVFQKKAEREIRAACVETPRFRALEQHFDFRVTIDHPDTVQASFGHRSMFRKDLEGKVAFESGVCLLYSLGPTGEVIVTIYPSKSSLAKVAEDQLHIGLDHFSAYQLLKRVKSDIRALVAYGYVSSLDAEPTWGEWLRIAWLRWIKPSQVGGKFETGKMHAYSKQAAFSILRGAFTAMISPLGFLVVIGLLYFFGKSDWAALLKAK